MTSKPIFDAIDAGHVGTDWNTALGLPAKCAKDGEKWPCKAIVEARRVAGPVAPDPNAGKSIQKIATTPTLAPPKVGKK